MTYRLKNAVYIHVHVIGQCAQILPACTTRMWDMSTLIRRCENFGHFYIFISRLVEASERQTMA